MKKRYRILFYNWVQFDDKDGTGGGVTVYVRNLIEAIVTFRSDVEIFFLSSGWAYDKGKDYCYVRQTKNIFGSRCKTYEIVNSPVPAFQKFVLKNISATFESKALNKCLEDFLENMGQFDIIHFHNIEGLSLDCFEQFFAHARKTFYSMHNYIPICPTGFYFNRTENKICVPSHTGAQCTECAKKVCIREPFKGIVQRTESSARKFLLRAKLCKEYSGNWGENIGLKNLVNECKAEDYQLYTQKTKDVIMQMDKILAVSNKVKDIAVENGIPEEKIIVSYIGTKVADLAKKYQGKALIKPDENLHLIFLGAYLANYEKGYPFLIQALKALPENCKKSIELTLTVKDKNKDEWLKNELGAFSSIRIIHGYTHRTLKRILRNQDLGIVPVMWEDNLPQIAIEMQSYGVPVLSSSYGGASELCQNPLFIYEGGNLDDLKNHIIHFVTNKKDLEQFWLNNKPPVTMQEHLKQLESIYGI